MTKHEIGSLASKLIGLYCTIHSLSYLTALGMHMSLTAAARVPTNEFYVYALTVLSFALTLGFGLYLFFSSERMAVILVGKEEPTVDSSPCRVSNIQTLVISLIGLFLTLQALPGFIQTALTIWFSYGGWGMRSAIRTQTFLDLGIDILRIGLGLWLLLGAAGAAKMVNKIRGNLD
jgi:hypothetical protein